MSGYAPLQARRRAEAANKVGAEPAAAQPARAPAAATQTPDPAFESGPDAWSELAELLLDLMAAGGAAGQTAPQRGPRGFAQAETPPTTDPAAPAATPTPEPDEAPAPAAESAVPPAPAKAAPGSKAGRVLAGKETSPPSGPISAPEPAAPDPAALDPVSLAAEPVPAGSAPAAKPPPVPSVPPPAAPDGGAPRAIVARWQSGVAAAGGGMPKVSVKVPDGPAADLAARKDQAAERNAKAREGLAEEAKKVVPAPPKVEDPPAPPPHNPIPGETAAILAQSGKRLPDQVPPAFGKSPEVKDDKEPLVLAPATPVAGERPVPADLFQVLITPGAEKIAEINPAEKDAKGKPTKEAQQAQDALDQLQGKNQKPKKPGQERGEPVVLRDSGPDPAPPLPKELEIPVGQVIARLLAGGEKTASAVLVSLREQAWPGGVLNTEFPDIGSSLLGTLGSEVDAELHAMAGAANITEDQLKGMIEERRKELADTAGEAKEQAQTKGQETANAVREEGQKTSDAVASAAKAAEEETLARQEAAGGAADPAVINRRRDLITGWVREQVTVQTSNYQHAGEKRTADLAKAKQEMQPAYSALLQRLIYQIMTPAPDSGRKPRDPTDKAREARLADNANVLQTWQDSETKRIGEDVRKATKAADEETRKNRKAVEQAGDTALLAAKHWAENRINEGKGFWDRFVAMIESWLTDADILNAQWRVRRTRENRDAVAADLAAVEAARKRLAEGLSQEEVLADASLSEAQKRIIKQFFALPAGTSPLEFAARRLTGTIAAQHLGSARPVFEKELAATAVGKGDYATAEKLNRVARSLNPGFDAAKIAEQVHGAMDQLGTDEDKIFASMRGLTSFSGMVVRKYYTARYGSSLDEDLKEELSDNWFSEGGELSRAQAQLDGKAALADAMALHDAVAGLGTDEAAIMAMLRGKTPEELEAIRAEYRAKFGEELDDALKGDLAEGNEIDQAKALLSGDTETADAIALDEAMRGGITGLGTSEEDFEKVQTTVRDEVMARAKAEKWTSAQAEAEVRRRMKGIETKFGERYKNVEQYNAPGLTGDSVLKRAFSSELSGPELDMANALQDNDLIKADAARIEIERTGFYASDEKLVKVMRSQYERALEARRLDEGPARQMRIERAVEKLRDQADPRLTEEQISAERIRLERQMEKELDKGAQADSKLSTEALRTAYEGTYNRNLAYTLAFNMSGTDSEAAQALLKQGGKLSNLQEIEFATKGDGTDEEQLKKTLSGMTREEIKKVKEEWEARHKGKDFYAMLNSELSGREASDIMDMAYYGAPESAMERIAQEKRRVDREREDLTGPLGRTVDDNEDSWMSYQLKELEGCEKDLKNPDLSKEKRQALVEKVDFQVQRVQDAVEDHRRRIDSYTDAATQAVGLVVGVAVAIILGAVSGGTLGVATIAFISSLYATTATIATKMLMKGGAYGIEEYGVDLAVGAVDAMTAVATAGMGTKLLGPMKNLLTKTRIGDVAGAIGKSGIAQKAAKAPGLGTALKTAGKVLPSPATLEKGAVKFMAESAENAVGAIPSTFTQLALTDTTWKGDPLMNFLEGGGMSVLQAVAMGHLMAQGVELGTHAFKTARGEWRMGTDVGRLLEASRLFSEGYGKFQESNPGASMGDFLSHPEGRALRAEIDARGLMPTIESVNAKLAADPDLKAAAGGDPAHPDAPAKRREAQLTAAIPDSARQGTFVTADPALTGNTVRVEPVRIGDRIIGVEVKVGPDATPLDIAMHGATIDAMKKYTGVLGAVRESLENAAAWLTGSGLHVGSRGWEARLEMAKLPAILDARIEALAGTALTPEMRAKVEADIASLDRQFHDHQAVFYNAALRGEEGRGYVAAEGADEPHPSLKKLANLELEFDKKGPRIDGAGEITDLGRLDLREKLKMARELVSSSRKFPSDDPRVKELLTAADTIIQRAADFYAVDRRLLSDFVLDGGRSAELKGMLKLSAKPEVEGPVGPRKPNPAVAELNQMIKALQTPDPDGPLALVDRIRAGGSDRDTAQAKLNAQSTAPKGAELISFSTQTLELAFAFAGGVPETGRAGKKTVIIDGHEMVLFSPRPDPDPDGRLPPPTVAVEMVIPPAVPGKPVVYQFFDGALRVWHGEPTAQHPDGVLRQETIISPSRQRIGHEDRIKSHGKSGANLAGAPTERAHLHGGGLGQESSFGIGHAPREVNQIIQNKGVEKFMRDLRDWCAKEMPGATLSYQTDVEFHPGPDQRQSRITYKIDITVQGRRTPFAEFAIGIEADPPGKRPIEQRGSHSSVVDPISRRYSHESPEINRLFDALWESVDVPGVLTMGLAQARSRNIVIRERMARMSPEAVAKGVTLSDQLQAHNPGTAKSFRAKEWEASLGQLLNNKDTPTYIVVDLRKRNLTRAQQAAIFRAISRLPAAQRYRVVVVQ